MTAEQTVPRLFFRLPLDPARLQRARERIRDYLHEHAVSDDEVDDVVLAIEEAMTNAVRHSGARDDLEVTLSFDGDDLVAEIRDRGKGFDIGSFDPARTPDPLAPGGRGLYLIATLMDDLTLRRDGGLELRAVKRNALREWRRSSERAERWTVPGEQDYRSTRRRALLEEIDEAFMAFDWEYRLAHANAAARRTGLAAEMTLDHCPPGSTPGTACTPQGAAMREAMELGRSSVVEYLSDAMGDWVETRVYPTSGGVSVFAREIGERKRREQERDSLLAALSESEERFATVFDTSPFAMSLTRMPSGITVIVNDAFLRLFGFDRDEIVGRTSVDVGISDASSREQVAGELRSRGAVRDFEVTRHVKSGEPRSLLLNLDRVTIRGVEHVLTCIEDISTRRQAQEALRLSEERFRLALRNAPVSVSVQDRDLRYVWAYNQRSARPDQIIGQLDADIFAPDEAERLSTIKRRVLDEGVEIREQMWLDRPTGRMFLEVNFEPIRDDTGRVVGVGTATVDLTPMKVAEEALRENRAELAAALESMSDAVFISDAQGNFIEFNEAFATFHRFASKAECARTLAEYPAFLEVSWPDGSPTPLDQWAVPRALRGETVTNAEYVLRRKDTGETWVGSYNFAPIRDDHGAIAGSVVTGRDITRQKQADEALKRFELLASHSRDIILFMDRDGRILDANEAAVQVYGYSRDELQTLTIGHLRAGATRAAMSDQMAEADERGILFESVHRRKDGSTFPVEVSSRGATIDGRRTLVSVVRDISRRKAAEADRQHLLEQSQAMSEELQAQTEELQAQTEDLDRRGRLADALNAIDRLVLSTLDPDEAMKRSLDQGVQALSADAGTIELRDGDAWVVRYQCGFDEADIGLRLSDADAPNAARAAATGETFAVVDMRPTGTDVGFVRAKGLRAVLAVPLVVRTEAIGCLLFYSRQPRVFADSEVDFARKLGATAAIAIENGRLFGSAVAAERRATAELRNADLLLRSARLLGRGLDLRTVLDTLADVVLEALGHSRVTVHLWDAADRALTIAASRGAAPAPTETRIDYDQASRAFRRLLTDKVTVVTDVDSMRPTDRGRIDEFGSRLLLAVPLVAADELVGVLVVDDPGERRPFDEREVSLLEAIATQAATAIVNARVYEQQRHIAQTLQESLIHPLPDVAGLELGMVAMTAYAPELVGGDFGDVFTIDDDHVAIVVGDVAGKGIRAAALTETVRTKIRAFSDIHPSASYVLRKTNDLLRRHDAGEPHITAFLAILDPRTGHLEYASAGHPPPVHHRAGASRFVDVSFGLPLGTFEGDYEAAHATLARDDYLVLYTDGVTEARWQGELFGEHRLLDTVATLHGRPAQEVAEGVRDAALVFSQRLRDDLHVVVVRLV